MPKLYTVEQISAAIELYLSGVGLIAVGKQTGISYATVTYHMEKRGIPRRPPWKTSPDVKEKSCKKCSLTKPIEEFHSSARSKVTGRPIYGWCKACTNAASMRSADRDVARRGYVKRQYGLSTEDYAEMVDSQSGKCFICQTPTTGSLFIDHDHATGKIRKLLCIKCNSALGFMKDDIELAERFVDYLIEHSPGLSPELENDMQSASDRIKLV